MCQRYEDCAPFVFQMFFGTAAVCRDYVETYCEQMKDQPGVPASYPQQARNCMALLVTTSCECTAEDVGCDFPAGTNADGVACAFDEQCSSGYCFAPEGAACGTCDDYTTVGEACGPTLPDCAPELDCGSSDVCVARHPIGGVCDGASDCLEGLVCINDVCANPLQEGDTCSGSQCDFSKGLYCDNASSTCEPYPVNGLGEDCGLISTTPVAFAFCSGDLYCTAEMPNKGVCAERGDVGESCNASDPTSPDPSDHTCKQPMYCPSGTCAYPQEPVCP